MDELEPQSEVEGKWGDKQVRVKTKYMAELISLMLILVVSVLTVLFYQHLRATDDLMKEMVQTNKEMVSAQREMNCLIATDPDKRADEYRSAWGLCKRMGAR